MFPLPWSSLCMAAMALYHSFLFFSLFFPWCWFPQSSVLCMYAHSFHTLTCSLALSLNDLTHCHDFCHLQAGDSHIWSSSSDISSELQFCIYFHSTILPLSQKEQKQFYSIHYNYLSLKYFVNVTLILSEHPLSSLPRFKIWSGLDSLLYLPHTHFRSLASAPTCFLYYRWISPSFSLSPFSCTRFKIPEFGCGFPFI